MPTPQIALSSLALPADGPHLRQPPRPVDLRGPNYAARFDATTLFYDVYRAGAHVVLQGPPFLNLQALLAQSAPLAGALAGWWPRARIRPRFKAGEIWWRNGPDHFTLSGPLGTHAIAVQPDGAALFAGRRVIHTLSKDNDIAWIIDWARFYQRHHGADAVLLYDNGSSAYDAAELEETLATACPQMLVRVVSWSFPYGPQGGLAAGIPGIEAPWDSDFCQTGSMQHARHRFLRHARSVLNADIDELVLGPAGQSIFAAAEASRAGFVKFAGRWISAARPDAADDRAGALLQKSDQGRCGPGVIGKRRQRCRDGLRL